MHFNVGSPADSRIVDKNITDWKTTDGSENNPFRRGGAGTCVKMPERKTCSLPVIFPLVQSGWLIFIDKGC